MRVSPRRNGSVSLLFALVFSMAALSLFAADQRRVLFGPEKFVRNSSEPATVTRSFRVAAIVGAPFTLRIVNGEPDPKGGVKNAVASASVLVDGHEIAEQSDFSATTEKIEKTLTLT